MKKFLLQVGGSLLAAALIANVTLLWNFNARLAVIETKLTLSSQPHITKNP